MNLTIEIDEGSGFCFGVTTAIKKAEEELAKGNALYCLGDIVHNGMEVERLHEQGLVTINHDDLRQLHDVKVLLRAHGEPPETYALAQQNNIEIIDATCPVVLALQRRIKRQYDAAPDAQIVIFGKRGHAEVLGLVGQTAGKAIVVEKVEDVERLDFSRDIYLYSQTTKSLDGFHRASSTTYNSTLRRVPRSAASTLSADRWLTVCRTSQPSPRATTSFCLYRDARAAMARCSSTSVAA